MLHNDCLDSVGRWLRSQNARRVFVVVCASDIVAARDVLYVYLDVIGCLLRTQTLEENFYCAVGAGHFGQSRRLIPCDECKMYLLMNHIDIKKSARNW